MSEIKKGDFVRISGQDTIGEVVAVRGNTLEITAGLLKFSVKKDNVLLADKPEKSPEVAPRQDRTEAAGIDTREKLQNFHFELDLRGKHKEEVLGLLSTWVDDAILLGISQATVFHGRGTGMIRDTVRSFLRKNPFVEDLGDESPERGGDYKTFVKFRH